MASTTHKEKAADQDEIQDEIQDESQDESIERISLEEGKQLLDQQARKFLNMSGEEFVRRYQAGEIQYPHRLEVARVAILLPFAEL